MPCSAMAVVTKPRVPAEPSAVATKNLGAQRPELVGIEHLVGRIEAQDRRHMAACGLQAPREVRKAADAYAAPRPAGGGRPHLRS